MNVYTEYFIEYDEEDNSVYVSGLTPDGEWEEFKTETDIAEPESYAFGYQDALKLLGFFSTVEKA